MQIRTLCLSLTSIASAALVAIACSGEGSVSDDVALGSIRAQLSEVPVEVHCVRVLTQNDVRDVARSFSVTPGESSTLQLRGLPTGPTLFSAQAFDEPCGDLTTATPPSWLSPEVDLTLHAGIPAVVRLSMRRNTEIEVIVDFEEVDGGMLPTTDASTPTSGDAGATTPPGDDAGPQEPCVDPNPPTCEGLDMQCGFILDACGEPVDCGTCADGTLCRHPVRCSAFSCGASSSTRCGPVCNPALNPPVVVAESCIVFTPPTEPCIDPSPATCESSNHECGTIYDFCGRPTECGSCGAGQACALEEPCTPGALGIGCFGVAHVCQGCEPNGCSGLECGSVVDCNGNWQECGSCPSGESCVDNTCRCPSTATACAGRECGPVSVGDCNYNCGSCSLPELCSSGQCVDPCANVNCGTKHICIGGICEPIDLELP